ncbi:MAG: hypothetical protein V3T65_06960 [Acidobacteriota bacterium]
MSESDLRLKLDYDGEDALSDGQIETRLARAGFTVSKIERRRSPSGHGWHKVVKVNPNPESPMEIVALQAILGSDPYREASNVQRARNLADVPKWWRERWNVLYK